GIMELMKMENLFTLKDCVWMIVASCCKYHQANVILSTTLECLRGLMLLSYLHIQLQQRSTLIKAQLSWMCKEWVLK
ncbi:hypothetical protein RYX36_008670, partial [Vicia faba]